VSGRATMGPKASKGAWRRAKRAGWRRSNAGALSGALTPDPVRPAFGTRCFLLGARWQLCLRGVTGSEPRAISVRSVLQPHSNMDRLARLVVEIAKDLERKRGSDTGLSFPAMGVASRDAMALEGEVDEASVATEVGADLGEAQARLVQLHSLFELLGCKRLMSDLDLAIAQQTEHCVSADAVPRG
jgi:hypothetical protein